MTDTWRLIVTPPASGAWNMAVDEALLESTGRRESPPSLRLYAWDLPCLSLGCAQPFTDVDLPRLKEFGWQLVRRPTGGRAILHCDELTYSVAAPADDPHIAGTVLESYQRLAQALMAALKSLSLPVEMKPNERGAGLNINPVCFEVPSAYEITVKGMKLVGSAQARRRQAVLQHGSLPLYGDIRRILQVLVFPDEASRIQASEHLLERAATVQSILGRIISWEEAARMLAAGFCSELDLELQPDELTAHEKSRAAELVQEKYAHPIWTEKSFRHQTDSKEPDPRK